MTKNPEFETFIAVDWSGARGKYLKGIKVALAQRGASAPIIVPPPHGSNWSRLEVVHWLNDFAIKSRILVGFDFSFSGSFVDRGAYFKGSSFGDKLLKLIGVRLRIFQKTTPTYMQELLHKTKVMSLIF
jgi:hypothetical protein